MISFVGAGPGAADLLTVRATQRLGAADVVVWAASLVSSDVLTHCLAGVEIHDSKFMTLDDVCAIFLDNRQRSVVRLHSGDPTIFSAIGEQIAWCIEHQFPYEIVPGVSSMTAAAAAAGVELTIPGVSQSVVATRFASATKRSMPNETVADHARAGGTLAVFLSSGVVDGLVAELLVEGSQFDRSTSVVAAHKVTWPDEELVRTTIGDLAAVVAAHRFDSSTMFLIGPALDGATDVRSHVYDACYTTRFRNAARP